MGAAPSARSLQGSASVERRKWAGDRPAKAMPSPARNGGRLRADQRREQIIRTLLSLISSRSPGEVSTQLIADAAGVSQATIFKHFPTKAALWMAAAHWLGAELNKIWLQPRADTAVDRPLIALEDIFRRSIEFVAQYPAVVRILISDSWRAEYSEVLKFSQELHCLFEQELLRLLKLAVRSRSVAADLNLKAAVNLFNCCILGLAVKIATFDSASNLQKETRQILKLFFNAIGGAPVEIQKF